MVFYYFWNQLLGLLYLLPSALLCTIFSYQVTSAVAGDEDVF